MVCEENGWSWMGGLASAVEADGLEQNRSCCAGRDVSP